MKVFSVLAIAPLFVLASCATSGRPPAMPEWTPETTGLAAASAPRDIDDDEMRVPNNEEPRDIWPAKGLYIGGSLITAQPMDIFEDGVRLGLQGGGPNDEVLIPELDVGAGASVYISYRWRMNELLAQYSITEHDGTGVDGLGNTRDLDTTFYDFQFAWRHYFWERSPFQPYALLGVVLKSRGDIEDGSTDTITGLPVDAEVNDGVGADLGLGASLYLLPWVSVFGQGTYRFLRYESARGFAGKFPANPDLDADGWAVSFGASVCVIPGRD
jgi:hypothetical protein